MRSKLLLISLFFVAYMMPSLAKEGASVEQVRVTPTPVRVIIPTVTIAPTQIVLATPTATWTPTPQGPVQIRVSADSGEVNVRSEPDPASQRLGAIKPGETFVVRGRYFSWLLFDFAQSPTGTGWVYDQLVEIVGDASLIPEVDPYADPNASSNTTNADLPTGETTATTEADARIITLPTDEAKTVPNLVGVLATFTPVSEALIASIPVNTSSTQSGNTNNNPLSTVPPIFPITLLIGFGVLGFVVGSVRR